jgi:L-arabinonolactonase
VSELTLLTTLELENKLGEGVIWDPVGGIFWWTDIEGHRLYRYQLANQDLQSWTTPERLASFALVEPGSFSGSAEQRMIAGFESGFAYYEPESGLLEWLINTDTDNPHARLNDGRADRQQRFWAGGMVEPLGSAGDAGKLYCLDRDLQCTEKLNGIAISNSLCWSPNSQILYHTDTPTQRIDQYDFNPVTAALSNRREFVATEAGCYPDGSTVDSQGYVWNAQWGGSQIVRYSADGTTDLVLPLPVSQPTCVAFGGANLDILFITSARQGLSDQAVKEQPLAGSCFIYQTPFRGINDPTFRPRSKSAVLKR